MKLAIHHSVDGFSERWIQYCKERNIPFKTVNCYQYDIVDQLKGCDGLLWHWSQNDYKAMLFAKQLTLALEKSNVKTFPDTSTGWHFDDKVGQKYLMESMGCPLVKSHVFYSKKDAVKWLDNAEFPKVFKLRGGASSVNVSLVNNRSEAKKLINKAFQQGFLHVNRNNRLRDRFYKLKKDKTWSSIVGVFSGAARMIFPTEVEKFSGREKGYIYFQDFVSDNTYDTRLVVVGDRCFGSRRYCRKGDFRASGSGISDFDESLIDLNAVKIAFEVAGKLNLQSVAFDFVMDKSQPKIIEVSYCFPMEVADSCPGYWDKQLQWHPAQVNAPYFMIEDFINHLKQEKVAS